MHSSSKKCSHIKCLVKCRDKSITIFLVIARDDNSKLLIKRIELFQLSKNKCPKQDLNSNSCLIFPMLYILSIWVANRLAYFAHTTLLVKTSVLPCKHFNSYIEDQIVISATRPGMARPSYPTRPKKK